MKITAMYFIINLHTKFTLYQKYDPTANYRSSIKSVDTY